MRSTDKIAEKFWSKVNKGSKCWNWTGPRNKGYGWFYIGGRGHLAHRISYYFHIEDLPKPPYYILHKCNNKLCVNPEHLYKGTAKENKADQIRDTGIRSGGRSKKLGTEQILYAAMLSISGKTQREIAKIMGVSQWNIWNILRNPDLV